MKVYFATTNELKLNQIKKYFNFEVQLKYLDIIEIQGTAEEVIENKLLKAAESICEGECIIVDDTGLCISALYGFPGPYIKDFLTIGTNKMMEIVEKCNNYNAKSYSYLGLAWKTNGKLKTKLFYGECEGKLIKSEKSSNKFFNENLVPNGCTKVLAELDSEELIKYNHRAKAAKKVSEFIEFNEDFNKY